MGFPMRLLNSLLALALLAVPAFSTSTSQEISQFCGIDDTDAGNIIPDCAAKSAINVETNLGATAISNRQGFTQQASLSVGTAPVIGSAYFRDSSGNEYIVACNGSKCSSSKNGAAFTIFYTTASLSATQYSFFTWNGALYGADSAHDAVWKYDGTNFTNPTNIPACSILAADQDRMICANTSGNPNGLNFSKSGDYTIWAPGVNSPDPFVDFVGTPGDQITGVTYWLGVLYIFKQYSIMACLPGDQYTTSCTQLNTFTGTTDGNSIVQAPDGLYFEGTDNNFWKYDGYSFTITSLKIQNTIKTFNSRSGGGLGFNIQTGQQAFQAGTQNPSGSFNTTIVSGSILPSTSSVSIQLSSFNYVFETPNGDFSNGTLNNWTQSGSWLIAGADVNGGACENGSAFIVTNGPYVCSSASSRSIRLDILNNSGSSVKNCSVNFTCGTNCIYSSDTCDYKPGIGGLTQYFMTNPGSVSSGASLKITDQSSGNTLTSALSTGTFSLIGIEITRLSHSISGVCSVGQTALGVTGCGETNYVTNAFQVSGTTLGIVSPYYDTGFSRPIWGPVNFSVISGSSGSLSFQTSVATSVSGGFDSYRINSAGSQVASANKEFIQIYISTQDPAQGGSLVWGNGLDGIVSLPAATTGTFVSQCVNLPSTISSFGTLSCNTSITGAGTLTFFSTTAATCAGLPTSTQTGSGFFTPTTNGSNIPVSTNTAFEFRADSFLTSSTDTAQLNACTINFKTGNPPPPVWGIYTPVNNAIYWSGTVSNSTSTNRTFKYDLNNGGWFPFDLPLQAPLFYKNSLYFGSGLNSSWNLYGQSANSDNGAAINSYWISKDWSLGEAFQEKSVASVSLVAINQGSGNLTVTQTGDGYAPGSNTFSIGTSSASNYIRDNYLIPVTGPLTFFNVEFSNNAANNPWSILGYRLDFTLLPWRVLGPP